MPYPHPLATMLIGEYYIGSLGLLLAALLNEDNNINGTSFSSIFINAKLLRAQVIQRKNRMQKFGV